MNLGDLFKTQKSSVSTHLAGRDVSGIVFNTANLRAGSVFVAIRGSRADGHSFLKEAVAKGAAALVVEDEALVPSGFDGLVHVVSSSRKELARLAAKWSV